MTPPDERDLSVAEPQSRRAAAVFVGALTAALAVVGLIALLSGGEGEEPTNDDDAVAIECTPVADDGGSEECPTEAVTEPASVDVETSEGDFTIELDPEDWPATSTSFRQLVEAGFYDGNGFHRIVPGFVVQGGDPFYSEDLENPRVGSGGAGYSVTEDVPPETTYPAGTVAMAKAADEASGASSSQFFVVSGQGGQQLTPDYAIAGRVAEGQEVVDRINGLGQPDERPSKPVTIESMTVVPAS